MEKLRFQLVKLCGVVLLTTSGVANAGLVSATWSGIVGDATAGNGFGVEIGDLVSGYAVFDTDWLGLPPGAPPGFNTINHNFDPLFQMGVSIGTRTFVESEDTGWMSAPFSLPTLVFSDISSPAALEDSWGGMFFNTCPEPAPGLADCSLATDLAFSFDPTNFPYGWTVHEDGELVASGEWLPGSFAVPIPAALPLTVGGLIAMFGVARRRRVQNRT